MSKYNLINKLKIYIKKYLIFFNNIYELLTSMDLMWNIDYLPFNILNNLSKYIYLFSLLGGL